MIMESALKQVRFFLDKTDFFGFCRFGFLKEWGIAREACMTKQSLTNHFLGKKENNKNVYPIIIIYV